jgi:hypothetical protein
MDYKNKEISSNINNQIFVRGDEVYLKVDGKSYLGTVWGDCHVFGCVLVEIPNMPLQSVAQELLTKLSHL